MISRPRDVYRVFAPSASHAAVGIVAIVNIHPRHRHGTMWVVLGDKRYSGQGYTAQASSETLKYVFDELKLNSISSYVVDSNRNPLVSILGFRYYGRQRECHYVDGRFRDRVWYELLSAEFTPVHYHEVDLDNRGNKVGAPSS